MFMRSWNNRYNALTNNCQHFAAALKCHLTIGTCAQRPRGRKRRQDDTAMVQQQIDSILSNCSIVCCEDKASSSALPSTYPVMLFCLLEIITLYI